MAAPHPNAVADRILPTLRAWYYPNVGPKRAVGVPFSQRDGTRFVAPEVVMKGFHHLPVRRTSVQVVYAGGVTHRYLLFSRMGAPNIDSEALLALCGGAAFRGDLLLVRRGEREGEDFVSITSRIQGEDGATAVVLFLKYFQEHGTIPRQLSFAEEGVPVPFGPGEAIEVANNVFHLAGVALDDVAQDEQPVGEGVNVVALQPEDDAIVVSDDDDDDPDDDPDDAPSQGEILVQPHPPALIARSTSNLTRDISHLSLDDQGSVTHDGSRASVDPDDETTPASLRRSPRNHAPSPHADETTRAWSRIHPQAYLATPPSLRRAPIRRNASPGPSSLPTPSSFRVPARTLRRESPYPRRGSPYSGTSSERRVSERLRESREASGSPTLKSSASQTE